LLADNNWSLELQGKLPPSLIVVMEGLSAEYGWTPEEIKKMSYYEVNAYWSILNKKRKLEQRELKSSKNGK
jgi:hypothetical protein